MLKKIVKTWKQILEDKSEFDEGSFHYLMDSDDLTITEDMRKIFSDVNPSKYISQNFVILLEVKPI